MSQNTPFSAVNFLRKLKSQGNGYSKFPKDFDSLSAEVSEVGLNDECIALLFDLLKSELAVRKRVALMKCMIPSSQFPDKTLMDLIVWIVGKIDTIPSSLITNGLNLLAGLWQYELVNQRTMTMYYECFFLKLMTSEYVTHFSRLIFLMTKPDHVRRREVQRILRLQTHFELNKAEWNRLNAVLLIFKTYKPDCVPENVKAINCERAWMPIPEDLEAHLSAARERMTTHPDQFDCVNTNLTVTGKKSELLLPGISYIHKKKSKDKLKSTEMRIYDINSYDHLGRFFTDINLPSQAVSLLNNFTGNHVLAFTDRHYQNRFMYNLYNVLRKAFIFDENSFTDTSRSMILKRITSFCKYINEGIPAVNYFLHEFLSFRTGEFMDEILDLMCWSYDAPDDLLEQLLSFIKLMFDEVSVEGKCKIFRMLRHLIFNLYVNRDLNEDYESRTTFFLNISLNEDVLNNIEVITNVVEELAVNSLITHALDAVLISEILTFYEESIQLQKTSRLGYITVAPPSIVYSIFAGSSVSLISRISALILSYDKIFTFLREKKLAERYEKDIETVEFYKQDFKALVCDKKAFQQSRNRRLLNSFENETLEKHPEVNFDELLSLGNHVAFLPRCVTALSLAERKQYNKQAVGLTIATNNYPEVAKLVRHLTRSED